MSINVTVVGATGITTVITNNDTVDVSVGTAFQAQVPSLMVEAGANITVTTTSGTFTIIGRDVPVQSVQGRAGNVVLTRADLTAAASSHQHLASDISNLTSVANVVSVQGRTGAVTVTRADLTAAATTHTHLAADISNLTSVANVVSVQGRTGAVTLTAADVSAASATHAHNYVQSLNAQTGSLSIVAGSNVTVTTAAGSITIASGGGGGGGGIGNVTSVAGRTGTVVLTVSDIDNFTSVANVVSVAGRTGVVTLGASDVTNFTSVANVVSVQGRTGVVSLTTADVTAASSSHGHNYVLSLNSLTGTPSIVAGSNVTVSTSSSSITVSSSGTEVSNDEPQPLGLAAGGVATNASRSDHVHQMPTAADVGAIDENSVVDGGDYVGVIVVPSPTISIISNPSARSVTLGSVSQSTASLPTGTWGAINYIAGSWFVSGNQATQADYYATSTDGATFTKRFGLPVAGVWQPFRYANSRYATRTGSTVATSSDGTTWSSTFLQNGATGGLFAADGLFLADTNTGISYSTDAAAWTQAVAWASSGSLRFARAGGHFFAGALNTGVRASANGTTWGAVYSITGITSQAGSDLNAVGFGSSVYIGGSNSRPVRYDTASQTWSRLAIDGTTNGGGQVATNDSILVFLSYTGPANRIWTSTNGTTWVARPLPSSTPAGTYASLFYAGGRFVVVLRRGIATNGSYDTSAPGTIYFTSANGIDWQQATRTYGAGLNYTFADSTQYADINASAFSLMSFGSVTGATTFSAEAAFSGGPVTYQWQVSTDGTSWANVTGATDSSITLTGLTIADNGKRYRAAVSASGATTVFTNPALLTVS
jgi:hypothetical protein